MRNSSYNFSHYFGYFFIILFRFANLVIFQHQKTFEYVMSCAELLLIVSQTTLKFCILLSHGLYLCMRLKYYVLKNFPSFFTLGTWSFFTIRKPFGYILCHSSQPVVQFFMKHSKISPSSFSWIVDAMLHSGYDLQVSYTILCVSLNASVTVVRRGLIIAW